jgi:two-component system chemotaxis response regulator CheB
MVNKIRIVSVLNSPACAALVSDAVKGTRDIEIVGTAINLHAGLAAIRIGAPDIVLAQDGPGIVEFTERVTKQRREAGIIIMTVDNDPVSIQRVVAALTVGAFDFITIIGKNESMHSLLLSKIRRCSIKQFSNRARRSDIENIGLNGPHTMDASPETAKALVPDKPRVSNGTQFDALLIGVSTGGPEALMRLLPDFPASMPIPVIIVLHMPREFTGPMAAALDRKSSIRVKETEDGEEPLRGKAYLARGGVHSVVRRDAQGKIRLHAFDGPPENGCRPSVDALFRTAAPVFGGRTLAVVLTGMGVDGTKGAETVKHHGGYVLAQDEPSSVVWGMPGSIVRAGLANEIAPLDGIASRVCELVGV